MASGFFIQYQPVKKRLTTNDDGDAPECMYHYLFNLFVFQFRVMDISYFMDECTDWELNDVVENIPFLDRNIWEASRMNAYVMAQINSRKKLTFQDICKFKWEEPDSIAIDMEISSEDIERLKQLSEKWAN